MLTFEQCMLLEKVFLSLLLSSCFLRHHEKRHLVPAEKPAFLLFVLSVFLRNYLGIASVHLAA